MRIMSARSNNSLSLSFSLNDMNRNGLPPARSPYNAVAQSMRRLVSTDMACKLGCKGAKCKYDSSDWPANKMVIRGLYSNWINEDILAMARPRHSLIDNKTEQNLVHEMKKAGIRSIFNLQTRGEHKDCGEGILKHSGFSYDPIDFTKAGIFYYNYELEDFSIAKTKTMIDMVKVLCFAISEGGAAIHCHAGLGRTGLFIACYLVYEKRLTADEAIYLIREKRPGSVQMQEQIDAIRDFENFLKPMRIIFVENFFLPLKHKALPGDFNHSIVSTYEKSFNLRTFLSRQRNILHGPDAKKLKYIPKILYVCGEKLKKILSNWKAHGVDSHDKKLISNYLKSNDTHSKRVQFEPNVIIAKALSSGYYPISVVKSLIEYQRKINESNEGWEELADETNPFILSALIWSWLNQLDQPVLNDQTINILLKNCSNGLSNDHKKTPLNWKDLDKESIYTINYLISIIHELLPLPPELEEDLTTQLISNLGQCRLRTDDLENDNSEDISLLNETNKIKRLTVSILNRIIKELAREPVLISDKYLGKFRIRQATSSKKVSLYDYEEKVAHHSVDEEEDYLKRKPKTILRKNNSN